MDGNEFAVGAPGVGAAAALASFACVASPRAARG